MEHETGPQPPRWRWPVHQDHAHDGLVARLLEAMPAAMFLVDADWRFSYVNAAAEALLGATRTGLLGERLWLRYPSIVATAFERHYRAAVATGEPVTFEAPGSLNGETTYEVRDRK